MSLVDIKSIPSTKSELDLFTVPPTQVVIKHGYWDEIQPMHPITNEGPYEFRIPPDPHYLQMNKNYIYMQLKIKKPLIQPVGGAAAVIPKVAPINLIGKTFFKQVKCYIGGRLVFDSSDKYAYRAYFETELNYGYDAKNSHLQSSLYYHDGGPLVDTKDSESFKTRSALFEGDTVVEISAPLHIDMFLQDRYLLNFTDFRLELHRNSNTFALQCFDDINAELQVMQMKLYIRKVEILDSVNLALEQTMLAYSAKYPIRRVMMTNLSISNPSRETPHHTLFTGQLPRRMVFACVDSSAYRGNISKSPFNFQPFGICDVKVICGGQTYPAHPFNIDFKNGKFLHAFNQMYESLDLARDNKGNYISRDEFKTSHCFFVFDLTPDEDDNGHWDLVREGTTSINIRFSERLPDSGVEIVVYAEFDNLIMIDKNRNTFHDYNA